MGQRGQGKGGNVPENRDQKNQFTPERDATAMQPGKILLEWKSKEVSDAGKAAQDTARCSAR